MNLIDEKKDYKSYSAADKNEGRAVAFLYILLGVKNLYGKVMYKGAEEILKKEGINYEYKTLTEFIEKKACICPKDEAVQNFINVIFAYETIRQKIQFLQSQKH